ncbi:MAG: metal-binding protein, partial [Lachnospiraceae bacterium]|nr:metal-binding protein [Lachnospiraceae bacterium]
PGNKSYIEKDGKRIKVCKNCNFPHDEGNYEKIIKILSAGNR